MDPKVLKAARKKLGLTQKKAAQLLGLSQPYFSLLEKGKRNVTPKLAQTAVRLFKLSPTALPVHEERLDRIVDGQQLAKQLAALDYPGFAYLRSAWTRNPAEVLLCALAQDELESRIAEALPWLVLHYADMDKECLLREARSRMLSNQLGFVVSLAKGLARRSANDTVTAELTQLEQELTKSRLDRETTFGQANVSHAEREWLVQNRSPEAEYWHVLSDWKPEYLQYA
jgi:transcriptional regulator with XRE-family HTH domain